MILPMPDHPLRKTLANEVHARPPIELSAPARLSHVVMLTGETASDHEQQHLAHLCEAFGVVAPASGARQYFGTFPRFDLRWERHTEFTGWTVVSKTSETAAVGDQFDQPAIDDVPRDWLAALPGQVIAAANVVLLARAARTPSDEQIAKLFHSPVTSLVADEHAQAWLDFRRDADATRILIHDRGLVGGQCGRLVQRLLEIETYRTLALLGFPLARRHGPEVTAIDQRLAEAVADLPEATGLAAQQNLLDRMLSIGVDIERVAVATNYRFSAASAYHILVQQRVGELRERRVSGSQLIDEVLQRRVAPALRTCESLRDRQQALSRRLARASALLRSRVDLHLADQNRALLASMNRRSRLQLRLQQTVEGLSVVAITYYAVGLMTYIAKALSDTGLPLTPNQIAGASVFPVALLIWWFVRRVRKATSKGHGAVDPEIPDHE